LERLNVLKTTDNGGGRLAGTERNRQKKKWGIDVVPHRKRMNDEALDEKIQRPSGSAALGIRLRDVAQPL